MYLNPYKNNGMHSDNEKGKTSRNDDGTCSVTPSIALLNRKLGTSPIPRMLTPSEIDLLRKCVKEVTHKVLASKDDISRT